MKTISYGRQEILPEDIEAVTKTLGSDFLTQGPAVDEFETAFAELVSVPYAVSVGNATQALHIAVALLGIKPGQKVLCPTVSFVASANCVRYNGAEVEFVDIDPETFCMNKGDLERRLNTSSPGAYAGVIVVHMAGYPANMEEISQLVKTHNLWIIEDSCHAPGAQFLNSKKEWVKVGSCEYSDISTFSFHPVKHIATGEGGMITTRSKEAYEKLKRMRSHGIERSPERLHENHGAWYYEMQSLGFNFRMPDILCALGTSQIKRFKSNIERRLKVAAMYDRLLTDKVKKPSRGPNVRHAFHLYVIRTNRRKELYDFLKTQSIYPQVHYIPIHSQPYYKERYGSINLPMAESYYQEALSLPMYHALTEEDQMRVISAVNSFFEKEAQS